MKDLLNVKKNYKHTQIFPLDLLNVVNIQPP